MQWAEDERGKGSNKAAALWDDNFMEIIVIIINGYQLCITLMVNFQKERPRVGTAEFQLRMIGDFLVVNGQFPSSTTAA